jgi:hypothetical protein
VDTAVAAQVHQRAVHSEVHSEVHELYVRASAAGVFHGCAELFGDKESAVKRFNPVPISFAQMSLLREHRANMLCIEISQCVEPTEIDGHRLYFVPKDNPGTQRMIDREIQYSTMNKHRTICRSP